MNTNEIDKPLPANSEQLPKDIKIFYLQFWEANKEGIELLEKYNSHYYGD